jgi:membrane-bound serine protease (ClpP class)
MSRTFVPIILAAAIAFPPLAAADTVTKTNGQKLTGVIVAESETELTLQTSIGELVVRTRIARDQIASFQKEAVAQNRYCRIPLHGEVGADIKAEWVAKAFAQAAGFNANYIILDIDSPGGSIAEMAKIMDFLSKQEKVHTVAHVHRAMSAAAMIALTCRTIVLDSHATIGAAVPWRVGPDGLPRDVEAKFLASYRALCKSAAEARRHSPLLAQGMMDMDLVLSIARDADGNPRVVEGTPRGPSTPLKKKGEILCLSSGEARASGLAAGIVEDARSLQRLLGAKDWAPVGESVWAYMQSRPAAARADKERLMQTQQAAERKERLAEALAKTGARMEELLKIKEEAARRVAALPVEFQAELKRIDPRLTPTQHDARNLEIRKHYETAYAEAHNTLARADAELQEIQRFRENASKLHEE